MVHVKRKRKRKRKMKSVTLLFLSFLSLEALCSQGCSEEESQALLSLGYRFDSPFSWNVFETDCCEWEGVSCNSSTGRVAELYLHLWNSIQHYINYSDFSVFKDLKNLRFWGGNIVGCVGNEGLPNLEHLDISGNRLDNGASVLSCLDGLPSLKYLSLIDNGLDASSFRLLETVSSKLPNLEVLDISSNNLSNDILPSLQGFTSLKELYLSRTGLDSDVHIEALCSKLRNLEVLDLSRNNFDHSDIASALSGLSSLKSLNLEAPYSGYSGLTWRSILNISKLSSLESLDLGGNGLNDSESTLRRIKENDGFKWPMNLQELWLNSNSLSDKSLSFLSGLSHLKYLNLDHNELKGELNTSENDKFKWPTNLQSLSISSNNLRNKFVSSLSGLSSLQDLDLSYNELEGELDISGLSTLFNLTNLDLSYNNIHYFVVHQDSSLHRLDVLNLDGNMIDGNKLRESLRALSSSIRKLSMFENTFNGTIVAGDFQDLSNLEHLTLKKSSNMENEFFRSIGNLTSLKVLTVSGCDINDVFPPADWYKLKKLEELNLINNGFEGFLPNSFINMTSLRRLDLYGNHFIGQFDSNIATLTSLEYFDLRENQFEIPFSLSPFVNHSNLKTIYGDHNKIRLDLQPSLQTWIPKFQLHELSLSSTSETDSLPLPKFLIYQKDLTRLIFNSLKLEGGFPHWLLENNTKLIEVVFGNCSLTGTMQLPLRPLPMLMTIDVSDNTIIGEIPSKNISSIYPNLFSLDMSINHFQGSIPRELGRMKLYELILSNNRFSGEIPKDIFEAGQHLTILDLSNNTLEGPIFTIPTTLEFLSLNDNNFSGRLPSNINTSIILLDISNNHFVGKIPMKNLSGLSELRMSNNHFEGFIPLELAQAKDLSYLDLSQNNLIGPVPPFLNSSVRFIHLSNNHLTGLSKKMFDGYSPLVMLDLSYNEISGNIQDMVEDLGYSNLNFLLLKGNHITGDIPKQLCQLIDLTMLDLSDNKFFGEIPRCLGTMPFDNKNLDSSLKDSQGSFLSEINSRDIYQYKKEKASFTSKKRIETYIGSALTYMVGIDLSDNKLKGNIPQELGNLTRIQALNLSHNDLIGQIPDSFSNLVHVESLDLSFNKLSGEIPLNLTFLTSLAVLSVAHNNLSGPTPEWKNQFATFDKSSYEGNPFLCGPPLPKSCHPVSTNNPHTEGDNDRLVDMYVFCVSFVVSFTLALLATVAALYINPYWRRAWFYYAELLTLNCYYFLVDHFCRFCNARNM